MFERDKHGNFESSFQGVQITIVHGIFLLLPTLDLWGLPSNSLFYLPSIASPSSPPPLSAEQPLLPGERYHLLKKWGTGPGHEQCRCWGVVCIDSRWRWAAPPTPACQLICTGDPPCSRRRLHVSVFCEENLFKAMSNFQLFIIRYVISYGYIFWELNFDKHCPGNDL